MSKARFTITTEDGPRTLFTVNERPNGDLVFDLKPPPFVQFPGGATPHQIERQKYSVHRSLSTWEGNAITQRTFYKDREPTDHYHFSRALKQHNRFAPMFVRRYPDLRQLTPLSASSAATVDLGDVQAEHFQLILGAYVGNPDRTFGELDYINMSAAQHSMTYFRVVVLWSFLTLPPHESGDIAHVFTQRPELVDDPKERRLERNTMNGSDEAGLAQGLAEAGSRMIDQFVAQHFAGLPSSLRAFYLESIKLLKRGRRDTPEWEQCVERLTPARLRLQRQTD